jgi:hypothetical protein
MSRKRTPATIEVSGLCSTTYNLMNDNAMEIETWLGEC